MKKFVLQSSVSAFVAFNAAMAFAQEATTTAPADAGVATANQPTATSQDDEIVVTARRREENVSRVPLSVTAFSGEQLEALGVETVEDLTRITPGLNISAAGAKSNPFIVIRGQSRAITGNGSPGVIVYQNEVPLSNFGALIPSFDLENMQVLRGPQGTLFGRNSIGGAILVETQTPTYDFEGYVTAQQEQYDTYQFEGAVNIPIVDDRLSLRLAAQVGHDGQDLTTFRYGPYTIDTGTFTWSPGSLIPNTHELGEFAREAYRASLLFEPTDWIENITVVDYSRVRGTPPVTYAFDTGQGIYSLPPPTIEDALLAQGAPPAFASLYANVIVPSLAQCVDGGGNPGPANCNYLTAQQAAANAGDNRVTFVHQDPWQTRSIVQGISNRTTLSLGGNHQLTNIISYRETDNFILSSLNGFGIPVITTTSGSEIRQLTEELQLSGSFLNDDLNYTLGAFYLNEEPNGNRGYYLQEINAFFGLSHSLAVTYLQNESEAVYGQIDYSLDRLVPGLSVTAGVRQTWDTQSVCATALTASPFAAAELISSPADEATYVGSEGACHSGVGLPADTTSQVLPDGEFDALTYTFGVNWQITPDALVYIAHRKGYRAGGINSPLFDPYLAAYQTFEPETLTDYEIGLKLRFGDRMPGALDIALFTGRDNDNQLALNTSNLAAGVCIPDAVGTTSHPVSDCTTSGGDPGALVPLLSATPTVNGGSLTIQGVEVNGRITPIDGLTLSAGASYTEVEVERISVDARLDDYLARAGLPLPGTIVIQGQPTWLYNAGIHYAVPGEVLGGDLSVRLDYNFTDDFTIVQLMVPSHEEINLRATLANIGGAGVSASAWVTNLTDEVAYNGASSSSPVLGAQSYGLNPPRTFGMSLTYEFGN